MLRDGYYLFEWKRGDVALCHLTGDVVSYTEFNRSDEHPKLESVARYRFLGETLT